MKLYGIYEQVVGVPASSLSQLRGPWPENVEEPWVKVMVVNHSMNSAFFFFLLHYFSLTFDFSKVSENSLNAGRGRS